MRKEILLYLFFGGLTTLVSISSFYFFVELLSMPALVGNVFSWVICVLFAYITNRKWVFSRKAQGTAGIIKECLSFFAGRVGTLLMEEAVLFVGIDYLHINSMIVKLAAQVLVVVGNYLISKLFVFRGGE